MDVIKLYATNEEQLQKLIALTHCISKNIGMLSEKKRNVRSWVLKGKNEKKKKT